jgi:hypothetical protein
MLFQPVLDPTMISDGEYNNTETSFVQTLQEGGSPLSRRVKEFRPPPFVKSIQDPIQIHTNDWQVLSAV